MKLRFEHRYSADVGALFELMTDPEFIKRKYAALGGTDIAVDRTLGDDGGCEVVTKRTVTVDLPGFAKRVMKPTNTVVQTETWTPAKPDRSRRCDYRVAVQGVPSTIDGTQALTPDAGGTQQVIDADVKVSIPLLGGRLEKFAVDSGRRQLAEAADFTDADLSAE